MCCNRRRTMSAFLKKCSSTAAWSKHKPVGDLGAAVQTKQLDIPAVLCKSPAESDKHYRESSQSCWNLKRQVSIIWILAKFTLRRCHQHPGNLSSSASWGTLHISWKCSPPLGPATTVSQIPLLRSPGARSETSKRAAVQDVLTSMSLWKSKRSIRCQLLPSKARTFQDWSSEGETGT